MPNLKTSYMNLTLKNPLIVASSGLTKDIDKIQACEQAGAGAVILKSLFEEALAREDWGIEQSSAYHSEATDYLRSELELQYGPKEYCKLLYEAKKKVNIPLIASVNCVSAKWWPSFTRQLEAAGADAIELNVFTTANDENITGASMEKLYYSILEAVKSKVKIPVAMKIGSHFTSLPNFASELSQKGLDALVLFNRFTMPDIDIKNLEIKTTFSFSKKEDMYPSLRWIALLSGKIACDLSATTGIHNSESIIKMLLAGASTVQVASTLYKNGLEKIGELLGGLESWMVEHKFEDISQFKGLVNFAKTETPEQYLRTQFIEKIRGVE